MRSPHVVVVRTWLCFALLLAPLPNAYLSAEEGLDVVTYVSITLERLERAAVSLETKRRPLTEAEESKVWVAYNTTARAYYSFASTFSRELEAYLAAHSSQSEQITTLSKRIRTAVDRLDRAPEGEADE